MGQQVIGTEGIVTSWGTSGDDCNHLIATGTTPFSYNLTGDTAAFPTTGPASGLKARTNTAGLRTWSAELEGYFPRSSKKTGSQGLVTFASGYVLHVSSWGMELAWPAFEITEFASAGVSWRDFRPGLLEATCRWQARVDSATAITLMNAPNASSAAITLKVSEEGATDNQFTGNVHVLGLREVASVGELVTIEYTAQFDGDVTVVGASNVLPAGVIDIPDWDNDADGVPDRTLTLTAASGRTRAGAAWLRRVGIDVPIDGLIRVTATAQGNGALTVA